MIKDKFLLKMSLIGSLEQKLQRTSERTGRVTTWLRPLTRVKHCRAGLVLEWVTDRDVCPWARHFH